jgi:hypothetical protein
MSRSNGKYAQFISDRSGMAFPYKEMVVEWNGSRVHVSEYEAKQPQLEPKPTVADPQGLQFARPARVEPPVLILLQTNPFQTIIYSGTTYVNVYSPNHERSTGNIVRFRGPTSASGYLAVPSFNGVTDISNASGFTIIVGKIDGSGIVSDTTNYFYFASTDTATTSGISGGGDGCHSWPCEPTRIMTYAELVQKIRDYTETDSNVLTATIVDGFIEDAEFRIFRDVDSDNNKRYATANLIASQRFIDVPADLLVVRSAQIVDGGSGSTRNFLEFRDTSFMSEYNSTGVTGEPKYYGMWDQNTIVLAPTPSSTYEIQLNYILKDPGLSSSNTTTYISTYFPNGLLYACLVEAFSFLKGPNDLLQLYEGKYKQVVEGFSIEQMGRRRRDEYQSGVPRVGGK